MNIHNIHCSYFFDTDGNYWYKRGDQWEHPTDQDTKIKIIWLQTLNVEASVKDNNPQVIQISEFGLQRLKLCSVSAKIKLNSAIIAAKLKSQTPDLEIVSYLVSQGADFWLEGKERLSLLHLAAMQGNIQALEILYRVNTEMTIRAENGKTPLDYAMENGRIDAVKWLLAKGAEPHFLKAVQSGKKELVNAFIEAGVDINEIDDQGHTALHIAAINGAFQLIPKLKEININTKNVNGETPLRLAIKNGHYPVVLALLELKADITNCLHLATRVRDRKIIKALIQAGASIDEVDNEGKTPLFFAFCAKTIRLFVAHQANVNHKDFNSYTPLMQACYYKNLEAVETLIEFGADIHYVNKWGVTSLQIAIRMGEVAIVQLLIHQRADLKLSIEYAILHGQYFVFAALVASHVQVNWNSDPRIALLRSAAVCGNTESVKALIAEGVPIFEDNKRRASLLHSMASIGNLKAIATLLNAGLSINLTDCLGNTPLHYAVKERKLDAMVLLLKRGASWHVPNALEQTPMNFERDEKKTPLILLDAYDHVNLPALTEILHALHYQVNIDLREILIHAVLHRDVHAVQAILKTGLNKKIHIFNQLLLVHRAVRLNHIEMLQIFINLEVDLDYADGQGVTACQLAYDLKFSDVVTLLVKHGATRPNTLGYYLKFPKSTEKYQHEFIAFLRSLVKDRDLVGRLSDVEWKQFYEIYLKHKVIFTYFIDKYSAMIPLDINGKIVSVPLNLTCMESEMFRMMVAYHRGNRILAIKAEHEKGVEPFIDYITKRACKITPYNVLELYAIAQDNDFKIIKWIALTFIKKNGVCFSFDKLPLYYTYGLEDDACAWIEKYDIPMSEEVVNLIFSSKQASLTLKKKAMDFIVDDVEFTIENLSFFLAAYTWYQFPETFTQAIKAFIRANRDALILKFEGLGISAVRLKYDLINSLFTWAKSNPIDTLVK